MTRPVNSKMLLYPTILMSSLVCLVSGYSSKRGIGLVPDNWSDPSNPSFLCGDMSALGEVSWWYDWGWADIHGWSGPDYSCPGGRGPAGFVPILRRHEYSDAWSLPDGDFTAVIGFNEPNRPDQDNVSPEWVAGEWVNLQTRFPSKTLVSPSPVPCSGNCNGGDMFQWFDSFFSACNNLGGCKVDFISTHIYTCSADYTMQVLQDLYNRYGKKIWLTEFACPMTNDPNTIQQYMKDVLPRLEAADFVDRYAWFASRFATQDWGPNWLLSSENSLLVPHVSQKSGLGSYYMSI